MRHLITILAVAMLTAILDASEIPLPAYELQSVIGIPCGGDLPKDLCTSIGDAIALTTTVLNSHSEQGWQLLATTPMQYESGNQGVIFLLGRNPGIKVAAKPPQRFQIIMATVCARNPQGLPFRLCAGNGKALEEVLNDHINRGWRLANVTSCTYRYEQDEVGMSVHLLSKPSSKVTE